MAARFAGCGWGSPKNHPRGRRVSDITCCARYVRNELLAQDRIWTAPQLCEAGLKSTARPSPDTCNRWAAPEALRTRYVPIGKPDPEEVEMFRSEENRCRRQLGRPKAPAPEALGFGRLDSQGKIRCKVCAQGLGQVRPGKPDINRLAIYVWFGHLEWEPEGDHRVRFGVLEGPCRTEQVLWPGRLSGAASRWCCSWTMRRFTGPQGLEPGQPSGNGYLPRYSPHLNPMEGVWRRIKGFLMPRRFYPTVVELRAAVTQVLRLLEEPELKIQCTGT